MPHTSENQRVTIFYDTANVKISAFHLNICVHNIFQISHTLNYFNVNNIPINCIIEIQPITTYCNLYQLNKKYQH